jgi:hypothetical protein
VVLLWLFFLVPNARLGFFFFAESTAQDYKTSEKRESAIVANQAAAYNSHLH